MTISRPTGLALESIADVDPVLWEAMLGERRRQHDKIELIASENYTFAAVMEAQGSWLTNKYAEGLPGKRYYGGCEFVDVAERLAQERALALFPGAEHVNVQPHSGAQANMAAYFSVLEPGDRIMGMNLAHGGHLTHGMALNFSGRLYEVHSYGVREDTERIDYDALAAQAARGPAEAHRRRRVGLSAAVGLRADGRRSPPTSARCCSSTWPTSPGSSRRASTPARSRTRTSSRPRPTRPCAARAAASSSAGATCRDGLDPADFPAVKNGAAEAPGRLDRQERVPGHPGRPAACTSSPARPSPSSWPPRSLPRGPAADRRERARSWPRRSRGLGARVVSGGTDNHLMLVDVTPLGVTGKEAEHLLDEIGITVNKNAIPFDKLPPNIASGIRIGTPGHDLPRLRAGRDARGRPDHHRRHRRRATTRPSRTRLAGEVREIVEPLPRPRACLPA